MEVLNYVLALVFSFFGIFIGMLLGYITKEELKAGKMYFIWIQNILLILAVVFVLFSFNFSLTLFIIIGLLMTIAVIYFNPSTIIGYVILAVLLYFSIGNNNLFIITSSFVFLYGLPTGSLILIKK